MTLQDTPLGCGPEGTVSKYADLVNTLETHAGSYGYEPLRAVLRDAGRTIIFLERELADWRALGEDITGKHGLTESDLKATVAENVIEWRSEVERLETALATMHRLFAEKDKAYCAVSAYAERLRAAAELALPVLERMDTLRHVDPHFPALDALRAALAQGYPGSGDPAAANTAAANAECVVELQGYCRYYRDILRRIGDCYPSPQSLARAAMNWERHGPGCASHKGEGDECDCNAPDIEALLGVPPKRERL